MPSRRVALAVGAAVLASGIVAVAVAVLNDDGSADPNGSSQTGDPVDLAVVGDSFVEQSTDAIVEQAEDRGWDVSVDAFGGTALCAWMPRLEELREAPPRMLVLSFAGNIFQPCVNPSCDPDAGLESCQDMPSDVVARSYRDDLRLVRDLFRGTGTAIYVALPPPIEEPAFEQRAASMREMYRAAHDEDSELRLIDTATRLDPDGQGFRRTLPCIEVDGCGPGEDQVTLRQDDGIHLTPAGGRRYAQAIFDVLDDEQPSR